MEQSEQTIAVSSKNVNLYATVQQEVELGAQSLKRGSADMAVTFFHSALNKLDQNQPFYDHIVHNLLLGYKAQIEQLLAAGDAQTASGLLRSALRLEIRGAMALNEDFRKAFAVVFQQLGLAFFKFKYFDESILCTRRSISIFRCPGFHINLTNALAASGQKAKLSDFTSDITEKQLGRHIFIACLPKSGSTFLKNLLVNVTGYQDVFMVYAAGQTEHELYLPTLVENARVDSVTQQHCRASDANIHMMQAFGIRPVVLLRNIFDSVMSLVDFYNNGADYNSYFRADYQSLDDETKVDLVIDNVIPWYLQFVASWSLVEKQRRLEILWLSYEDLIADKTSSIQNVLQFYGLGAAKRGIDQKIKQTESVGRANRFNKGVAGRGKSGLSDRQKERVRHLARYYPTTDFGRIGL